MSSRRSSSARSVVQYAYVEILSQLLAEADDLHERGKLFRTRARPR